MLMSGLSELLPSRNVSRGFLRGIMTETLRDSEASSILNEVNTKIVASIIKFVVPFTLRLIIYATAASVINGNLAMEAFKNIQPLTSNYKSISFQDMPSVIEHFLLIPSKHFSGDDNETHS